MRPQEILEQMNAEVLSYVNNMTEVFTSPALIVVISIVVVIIGVLLIFKK